MGLKRCDHFLIIGRLDHDDTSVGQVDLCGDGAGVFEQDDMELWASATEASDNPIARQYPYSFQTSLKYLDAPADDHPWPGRAHRPADTELAQFEFMLRWEQLMQSNR